jgi:hypothetical protein
MAEALVPTSPAHVVIAMAEPATLTDDTGLQSQLEQLKLPELRKRAAEEGVDADAIEVRLPHRGVGKLEYLLYTINMASALSL